jgi:putative nucleotidyltransferase with HDIG domain
MEIRVLSQLRKLAEPLAKRLGTMVNFSKTRKPKKKKTGSVATSRLFSKRSFLSLVVIGLFFAVFYALIAVGYVGNKLVVEIGEPSPVNIYAPYDREIELVTKYQQERNTAAASIQRIYKANSDFAAMKQDLSKYFDIISQAEKLEAPADRIDALRAEEDPVFNGLNDTMLPELFAGEDFERIQELSTRMILSVSESQETGAKTREEVSGMRTLIREGINNLLIPDGYKNFLNSFIELKITEPTLIVDEERTNQAREMAKNLVPKQYESYRTGQEIVREGQKVDEEIYSTLSAYDLIQDESGKGPLLGVAMAILAGIILFLFYIYRFIRPLFSQRSHLMLVGIMITIVLGLTRALLSISLGTPAVADLLLFLIPIAWLTMTLAILLGEYVALASGVLIVFFMLMMIDPSGTDARSFLLVFLGLIGTIGGIVSVSALDKRTDLARSGLYLAVINVAAMVCLIFLLGLSWRTGAIYVLAMAANGLLCSILMIGTLPWLERAFGITSAVGLLELSDPNNVLLRKMLIDAPGTYHHSIMVGNLAEAAAEQVGADPLLVRVGALYHDIGKLKRPYFFIENQITVTNPHDKITPTLSALIIISHVKDGIELAEQHKLPESIKEIIAQHHGDSRANFFYMKALAENPSISEEEFRYDGPKPMSKESAIVLLADNVEAIIRSHRGNTAGRLQALVHKIIQDKADEGLVSESELTFKDLNIIAAAFVKVLSGIFHSRITYPEIPSSKKYDNRGKLIALAKDSLEEDRLEQIGDSVSQDAQASEPELITGEESVLRTHEPIDLCVEEDPLFLERKMLKHPDIKDDKLEQKHKFRSDEFAETIYMTGSRFTMEESSSGSRIRANQARTRKSAHTARARRKKRNMTKTD